MTFVNFYQIQITCICYEIEHLTFYFSVQERCKLRECLIFLQKSILNTHTRIVEGIIHLALIQIIRTWENNVTPNVAWFC